MGKIKLVRDKHIISKVVESIDETSIGSREELVTSQAILNLKNDIIEIVDGDSPINNLNERYKYELENLEHYLDFSASLRLAILTEYEPDYTGYLPHKVIIPDYNNEAFFYTGTYITADEESNLFLQIEITDERYMTIFIYDKFKKVKCTLKGLIDIDGNFKVSCNDENIYNEEEILFKYIFYRIIGSIDKNHIMTCNIDKQFSDGYSFNINNKILNLIYIKSIENLSDYNFTTMLHNPNNLLNGVVYKLTDDKLILINNNYEIISINIGEETTTTINTKITSAKIEAGNSHLIGLTETGKCLAIGNNDYDQCNISSWKNIDRIFSNGYHTIGLTINGEIYVTGLNNFGQCNITHWNNIKDIKTDYYHSMVLFNDGTVQVVGANNHEEDNISTWNNIEKIDINYHHSVGVKSNGTVVATGNNWYGQTELNTWTDIVDAGCGSYFTLGLKSNGTCVIKGWVRDGVLDVSSWANINKIITKNIFCIGLSNIGTVFATGNNEKGQCNVSTWTNIIDVKAGLYHTVGLKEDGTVISTGDNSYNQCDTSSWVDIIAITAGNYFTAGLKSDGTVIITGNISPNNVNWQLTNIPFIETGITIDDDGNYLGTLTDANIEFKILVNDNPTSGIFMDLTNNINYYTKNILPPKILNEELEELLNKININRDIINYYLNHNNTLYSTTITLLGDYNTYYPIWFKFKRDFSNDVIVENFNENNKALYCHLVGYGNNNGSLNHSFIKHFSDNNNYLRLLNSSIKYKPTPTELKNIHDHFGFYLRGNTTYTFKSSDENILNEIIENVSLGQVENINYNYLGVTHILQPLSEDELNYMTISNEFRFTNSIERIR